jgi:hypothetical protein
MLYKYFFNEQHFIFKSTLFCLSFHQNTRNQALRAPNLQVWFILDGSDPKKSKNKMAIFILLKNVTTFYTNIFWNVPPSKMLFFCRKTLRKTDRRRRSNSNLDLNRNFISQYCFVEFEFKFFDKTVNKGDFLRIISLYKFVIFSYYEGNEILSSFVYSFHFHTS